MVIAVQKATAAGIVSWTCPVHCRLRAAISSGGANVITGDPAITSGEYSTPLADSVKTNWDLGLLSGFAEFAPEISPEFSADEKLFIAFGNKGTLVLYLEELT